MDEHEIKDKYRLLINDIAFDKMELLLKTPNIFQILNVSRTEIRHSNFLAWLLDPNGTHGLGRLFLTKFLRDIATNEIASELDEFQIEELNFNNVELRREWRNIDLLIIFDKLVICIENKIDSTDHSNQLYKYRTIVNESFKDHKKVFVYLTPTGEPPRTSAEINYYITYSYQQIIEHQDRVLQIYGNSLNSGIYQYISDYLTILKRELMKTDELNVLADKIYKSHKAILDLVFEYKTDIASKLCKIFVEKIEQTGWVICSPNKGYVRFLTPKLNDIIPRKGQGFPLKESFLFEIDFFWYPKKAVFKTVISPGDNDIQNIFCKALENIPEHIEPKGKKWLVHFQHSWKFETDEMIEIEEAEVKKMLETEWQKITDIVNKVETEIMKYNNELKQLK